MHAIIAFAVVGQETVFVLFSCALFAAALFVYVFYQPDEVETGEEKTRQMYLLERKEATYENLRDLNFEYKAGKLSEQDYAIQCASLEDEAAAILAELESIEKARSHRIAPTTGALRTLDATTPTSPKTGLVGDQGQTTVRHGTRRSGGRRNGGRA